jgi:branched-subunit amino acid aminotransferase/4-amino-4-deoxychorismate lyase
MGFSLLETMRLEHGQVVRRDRHLARAAAAAATLGFGWEAAATAAALDAAAAARPEGAWRTRLLISKAGLATVECVPLVHDAARRWRVALDPEPVSSDDAALRVKTTRRERYERARAARPDADDVLLWNERGEITESTIANVVAAIDGTKYTPPLSCGLLPGVFRAALLDANLVRERVITVEDLRRATHLWLINSLREWIGAELEPADVAGHQRHAP